MDASIYMARVIGSLLIVSGVGALLFGNNLRAVAKEFVNCRALVYLAGFMTLLIGLGVVNAWKPGWPVALTGIGWLFVVSGTLRMLFTDRVMQYGKAMLDNKPWLMSVSGIVQFLMGLSLMHTGHLL